MSHTEYIPLSERKAWMESHGIPKISRLLFQQILLHVEESKLTLDENVTPVIFSDIDETVIYNKLIGDYHEASGEWQSTNQQWKDWEAGMNVYEDAYTYPDAHNFFEALRKMGVKVAFITNSWNQDRVSTVLSIGGIRKGELYDALYFRQCEESTCKKGRFAEAYKDMQTRYSKIALLASLGDSHGDDASELGGKFFLFPNSIYRDCPYFEKHRQQQSA